MAHFLKIGRARKAKRFTSSESFHWGQLRREEDVRATDGLRSGPPPSLACSNKSESINSENQIKSGPKDTYTDMGTAGIDPYGLLSHRVKEMRITPGSKLPHHTHQRENFKPRHIQRASAPLHDTSMILGLELMTRRHEFVTITIRLLQPYWRKIIEREVQI
ncbi:hypothetical protein TNCV_3336771 [Trichonephila clavipes]|nr:hypothetical protein TNCV_3336771 [Trichonephila clavipes]